MYFSRGPNKIQKPYTLKDMYEKYCIDTEGNPIYEVSFKEYSEIVSAYYKRMMDHVLLESGTIYLPFNMGFVQVIKTRPDLEYIDHKQLDWKTTTEVGKRVYHLNEHSGGWRYRFLWGKKDIKLKNAKTYKLQMTRDNKRRLAKLIKSGEYDYYEKY